MLGTPDGYHVTVAKHKPPSDVLDFKWHQEHDMHNKRGHLPWPRARGPDLKTELQIQYNVNLVANLNVSRVPKDGSF